MTDDSDTATETEDKGDEDLALDEYEVDYSDVHRMVLQGFMAHGLMGPAAVKGLFKAAWKLCSTPPRSFGLEELNLIAKTVKEINSKISRFNFVIKTAACEFNGKTRYMFTATVDSPLMRLQTYFSKVEVELFKRGLEKMMTDSEDFTIGSAEFVHLASSMDGNVDIGQAEKVMEKMLGYSYFAKNFIDAQMVDYNLTLGIRGILELEPVISQDYPDALVHCQLCRKIMLHGYVCPKCPYVLHIYCYKKYVKNSKECPDCHHGWILEDRMVRRKNIEDKENDNETDMTETPDPNATIEDEMDIQPTPPIAAVSAKVRGRRAPAEVDSGESTDEFDY